MIVELPLYVLPFNLSIIQPQCFLIQGINNQWHLVSFHVGSFNSNYIPAHWPWLPSPLPTPVFLSSILPSRWLMAEQEQYDKGMQGGRRDEGMKMSNLRFLQNPLHLFTHWLIHLEWSCDRKCLESVYSGGRMQIAACQSQGQGHRATLWGSSPEDQKPDPRGTRDR